MKDRLDLWAGEFGDAYHARNDAGEGDIQVRTTWLQQILDNLPGYPHSALEVGCGCGANLAALAALDNIDHCTNLYGVEPNVAACEQVRERLPYACIFNTPASDLSDFYDSEIDLVFTSGVLIHIPDEGLPDAMAEIHRVAKRFILCAEYYGREVEEVPYRGEDGALWRRPYGDLWMKQFPDLKPLAQGFAWRRTTGLDDLTFFLFEKP